MPELEDRIARNLHAIQERMAKAAERSGRPGEAARLIAVTKTVGPEEMRILESLGVSDFGENRVEVAAPKIAALGRAVRWHMIGSIQRRKVRDVVSLFDAVDSVDRLELAETLQKRCDELDKRMPILLEVNVSGEEQKHGFGPDSLEHALAALRAYDRLAIEGLMTMAPLDAPESVLRAVFSGLRRLADEYGLRERSMGMTDDFEVAIEEGATQVRIGRALFT